MHLYAGPWLHLLMVAMGGLKGECLCLGLLLSIQLLAPSKLLLVSVDFAHVLRGRAEHGPAVKHWLGLLGKSRQPGGLGLDCQLSEMLINHSHQLLGSVFSQFPH